MLPIASVLVLTALFVLSVPPAAACGPSLDPPLPGETGPQGYVQEVRAYGGAVKKSLVDCPWV